MIDRLDIHAYADRELEPAQQSQLDQEISASPELARELDAIRHLKSFLQTSAQQHECADVWKGCTHRLDELDRVKKAESFVGRYAWALCGVLFVVILGGGVLNRFRGGSVGMGQVASDISSMSPLQSSGGLSQPEQLKSWIGDQAIHLDLRGLQIVGESYSDKPEGRVKLVRLRDSVGNIDLLLIPNVAGVDGAEPLGDGLFSGQVYGLNCVIKPEAGCAVLVVSDRDTGQLRDFALSRIQ